MDSTSQNSGYSFQAVIFDLDGVITKTASVHGRAWKAMFDEYLKVRESRDGEPFKEFTHKDDYLPFVDGKPRYEGVKSFLESRGIHIPFGTPQDPPGKETVCGLGNKKNEKFEEVLRKEGVDVFPSTIRLIHELKEKGLHVGVASSSKNCQLILQKIELESVVEARVDGVVSAKLGLKGKPEPDIFVTAAQQMGCPVEKSIVVEDAVSGVAAGAKGKFGLVIGLARHQNQDQLKENGADIVLDDFGETTVDDLETWVRHKA